MKLNGAHPGTWDLRSVALGSDGVVFRGHRGSVGGIFTNAGGSLAAIASTSTTIPGQAATLQDFRDPSIDGTNLAFLALNGIAAAGIYTNIGGSLGVVAATSWSWRFSSHLPPPPDGHATPLLGRIYLAIRSGQSELQNGSLGPPPSREQAVPQIDSGRCGQDCSRIELPRYFRGLIARTASRRRR